MKYLAFVLLVLTSCTGSQKPVVQSKKAFSNFSHLKEKTAEPFESTFLNPALSKKKTTRGQRRSLTASGPLQSTAYLWFIAYQNTLSRMDGSTCNFTPTCSGFALQAISKYGPIGFGLAFGRLHKNHLDNSFYHSAPPRLSDPLSNYTFWLGKPKRDDFAAHVDPAHAWFQHVSLVDE